MSRGNGPEGPFIYMNEWRFPATNSQNSSLRAPL